MDNLLLSESTGTGHKIEIHREEKENKKLASNFLQVPTAN